MCMVSELGRTSHLKFAMHVGECEVPGANIVVSMPIARPSKPGWPVVADARH